MAKQKDSPAEETISATDQINSFLKSHEKDHYNFVEQEDYTVSSGSLLLDIKMNGGIHPGILRLTGVTEGGKSSCALSFARNFQQTVKNGMVVYIRAEGRLSDEIVARAGVDTSSSKWFVYKSNVYESVLELIDDLVKNNPNNNKYFFVLDSMDSMIPRGDVVKGYDENNRVAGAAALSSDFLRRMSNPISSFGHICVMISQVRSTVKINQYEKTDPKVTNASGGNALLHYSDWILEFQQRINEDKITTEPNGKGEHLGHLCKIIFRKTPNEKTNSIIRYPIKYGRTGGKSVWIEREIVDAMMMFEMVKKSGSWLKFDQNLLKEFKDLGFECPEQLQGSERFVQFFEENPKFAEYMYEKLYKLYTLKERYLAPVEKPD